MTTLAEILPRFVDAAGPHLQLAPGTVRTYRFALEHAARSLLQPLNMISRAAIEGYLADIAAPATRAKATAALRRLFRWAVREELVAQNPTEGLEPHRTRR